MNESVTPAASVAPAAPPAKASRGFRLAVLGLVVVVFGVGFAAYWFLYARYYESTDDSYVDGDVVQITSEAIMPIGISRWGLRLSWAAVETVSKPI